ncbi:MAG: DUF6273 domain-containing protein [Bacilli bacterium]|nr:DUF6273 domain-containing protein [Bacilli bacterium]
MKTIKKIIFLLTSTATITSLLACGDKKEEAQNQNEQNNNQIEEGNNSSNDNQNNNSSSESNVDKKYKKEGNKIYFGSYPQNHVTDQDKIALLNSKVTALSTSTSSNDWTTYEYFIEGNVESYTFYKDIDLDNNGSFDYRGVYFTKYRPKFYTQSSPEEKDAIQNDFGYKVKTVHWFSYDTIEWNVLKEENGKAFIVSNIVLDNQTYYPTEESNKFDHNQGNGFANNYELSNIRRYLNNNFYVTSFNSQEKEIVQTTNVDNSNKSDVENPYVCSKTEDKIFLLSESEIIDYLKTKEERIAKGSDYSKCQGLVGTDSTCYWWLRSPMFNNATRSTLVDIDGNIDKGGVGSNYGIRPVCYISL